MYTDFFVKLHRMIREIFCLKLSATYCVMENL